MRLVTALILVRQCGDYDVVIRRCGGTGSPGSFSFAEGLLRSAIGASSIALACGTVIFAEDCTVHR
ncbi:MAG: hypothetical protein LUC44_02945 [Prevotellaceae bacterium]|nr:hypothetical protein [Prevotellaceae bacterium]